jgi:hypothetical protein
MKDGNLAPQWRADGRQPRHAMTMDAAQPDGPAGC